MTAMDGTNTETRPQTERSGKTMNPTLIGGTTDELAKPGELPMIVWLQGDEPNFDSFALNAAQTMELIGIKRSRLTQISGKELRVGRKREGRYIKPYYRKEDIEAYKEWTRATASHSKSSNLLEDAAKKLADRSIELEHKLKDFWSENLSGLKKELGHTSAENLGIFRDFLKSAQEAQTKEFAALMQAIDAQVLKQEQSLEPLIKQAPVLARVNDQLLDIQDDQNTMQNALRSATKTQSEQSEAIGSLQNGVKHLAGLLEIVLKTQKELLVMVDPTRRG